MTGRPSAGVHHVCEGAVNAPRRSVVAMDPIATARYGLMAASNRFEASATRIAAMSGDATVDVGQEMVGMLEAKHAFSANLTVIRFASDMWDSLLKLQAR